MVETIRSFRENLHAGLDARWPGPGNDPATVEKDGGVAMATVELPRELENRLDALARATGRSKVACLEEAVVTYLEDMEDARVAEQRLADVRAGRSETVVLEDLLRRHDVAD